MLMQFPSKVLVERLCCQLALKLCFQPSTVNTAEASDFGLSFEDSVSFTLYTMSAKGYCIFNDNIKVFKLINLQFSKKDKRSNQRY